MYLVAWNVENWPKIYPSFEIDAYSKGKGTDPKKYHNEIEQTREGTEGLAGCETSPSQYTNLYNL